MSPVYQVLLWVGLIAFAYFYGSVNNAIVISSILKRDIRKMGSGNPGAINMFRSMGVGIGILTLTLDALKGAIPSLLGWWLLGDFMQLSSDRIGLYVCAAVVLIGHLFPIYYKFKGGKGVASTIGICFVINPLISAITFVCAAIVLFASKIGFLASFTAIGIPCVYECVVEMINGNYIEGAIILLIFATVVFMHRANIKRFIKGEENKTILFGKNKTSIAILKKEEERQKNERQAQQTAQSNQESAETVIEQENKQKL